MTKVLSPKVSVIGCGNVGMRYAYALMMRGLARQLVMVDQDVKRAEGEVMDLCHGAPYCAPVDIIAGTYADIRGSDLVVITAGKKQKPGQTRIDLTKDNVALYRAIIPEIMRYAPEAKLLIVSNPIDVLAYAAYKISGKPKNEIVGSGTVLDSARFRFLLSRHCGLDPRSIHAYILGEHGDTEFPVWSKAMVGGMLFKDYCPQCSRYHQCSPQEELSAIFVDVRDAAYKIIERKGETSYGIGLSLVRISEAILKDENAILPVSSLVEGYLGMSDLYLSLPAIVNRSGVAAVLTLDLAPLEQEQFIRSAQAIKSVIAQVGI